MAWAVGLCRIGSALANQLVDDLAHVLIGVGHQPATTVEAAGGVLVEGPWSVHDAVEGDWDARADTRGSFRLPERGLDVGELLNEQQAAGNAAEPKRLVELGDRLMQGVHNDKPCSDRLRCIDEYPAGAEGVIDGLWNNHGRPPLPHPPGAAAAP